MRVWTGPELEQYCAWALERLKGAQLQTIRSRDDQLLLSFYRSGDLHLLIDLQMQRPGLILLQDREPEWVNRPHPVQVFLNAHGKNARLSRLEAQSDLGRVVFLELTKLHGRCEIQIVLIPRAANLLVTSLMPGETKKTRDQLVAKQISWHKPKPLPEADPARVSAPLDFNPAQLEAEHWAALEKKGSSSAIGSPDKTRINQATEKSLSKKRKAVEQLSASLQEHEEDQWLAMGKALLESSQCPMEFRHLWKSNESAKENRERAFLKAKEIKRKRAGTEERVKVLLQEIAELEAKLASPVEQLSKPERSTSTKAMQKAEVRGRTVRFSAPDSGPELEAVIAKSGAENLALLRQSRAWDYWLHLRDYPGAFAIVFRQKNQKVPDSVLFEVAKRLISMSRETASNPGVSYAVVVAECRWVKPVKGAKAGRVVYTNSRTLLARAD